MFSFVCGVSDVLCVANLNQAYIKVDDLQSLNYSASAAAAIAGGETTEELEVSCLPECRAPCPERSDSPFFIPTSFLLGSSPCGLESPVKPIGFVVEGFLNVSRCR